jgi:hypothetical protein
MSILPRVSPIVVKPSAAVSPTSQEVRDHLRSLAERAGDLATVRTVGTSGQGRPIEAVALTDPSAPDDAKQHVMILAGQHGNEESGRQVALDLMDLLVDKAQRPILRQQKIVVMPNVNPDGAEADSYETPDGIRPNMDHGLSGPATPEGRAVEDVAYALVPDVFVDMHARGHAGCSYDMVLYPQTRSYTEDDNTFHAIAADMVAAGERAGLPHITHPLAWWTEPPQDVGSTTAFAYRNFKSIVMLTESAEHNELHYPRELTSRVGVARVMALLAWGNQHHPRQPWPGYPNNPVLGMSSLGVVSVGTTAAARRASRVELWRQHRSFKSFRVVLPEHAERKSVLVEYAGPTLELGAGVMVRVTGSKPVRSVTWDGVALSPSHTDGWFSYRDEVSTFVVAARPTLASGSYVMNVELA